MIFSNTYKLSGANISWFYVQTVKTTIFLPGPQKTPTTWCLPICTYVLYLVQLQFAPALLYNMVTKGFVDEGRLEAGEVLGISAVHVVSERHKFIRGVLNCR